MAVFVDTEGLAACYENEDKAAQIQKVRSDLGNLSDVTGALVISVDHYGKDQHAGLRDVVRSVGIRPQFWLV